MAIRTDFAAGEVLAAADLNDTFGAKLNLAGGKILQIVRATGPSSNVSTTSTSYVDVTSMSITITPQKNNSNILLIFNGVSSAASGGFTTYSITDSSNVAISGSPMEIGGSSGSRIGTLALFAYASPASTSAQTYKLRFLTNTGTATFYGTGSYGNQMYAIEVSA